eukprot:scaffold7344_cov145-Cylindrotheca_fusiformis.AAC.19
MGKARILCLHGGGSNDAVTEFQTAALKLGKRAECHYLHAPHETTTCYPGLDQFVEGPFYTWADSSCSDSSWEESLDYLAQFLKDQDPFDGVYGFSQGVAVITSFSHPRIWKDRYGMESCPWKCAVLACGGASEHCQQLSGSLLPDIPSFHIFGKMDPYLPQSRELEQRWSDDVHKVTCTHQKGHEIDLFILNREKELGHLLADFLDRHLG